MATLKQIWDVMNRVITIINGFLFGILGGFSPLHKQGREVKLPLIANMALLMLLIFVLFSEIRVHYY